MIAENLFQTRCIWSDTLHQLQFRRQALQKPAINDALRDRLIVKLGSGERAQNPKLQRAPQAIACPFILGQTGQVQRRHRPPGALHLWTKRIFEA